MAYGALLIEHLAPGIGSSESAGHANAARAIIAGRIVEPIEALDSLELPDRFAPALHPALAHEAGPRPLTMVPRQSPGFALHVALGSLDRGLGRRPSVVSPIAALGVSPSDVPARPGARALAPLRLRRRRDPRLLHGLPLRAPCSRPPTSPPPLWAVAAVFCALRSRRGDLWALAAGAAFGIAVLVRPANLLLLLPLAFAWNGGRDARDVRSSEVSRSRRSSAPGTGPSGGGVLDLGATDQFGGRAGFRPCPRRASGTTGTGCACSFRPSFPLGWLGVAADRRVPVRERAMLLLWFAPFFLFNCLLAVPLRALVAYAALLPARVRR